MRVIIIIVLAWSPSSCRIFLVKLIVVPGHCYCDQSCRCYNTRTATEMDGTLHTDFRKFETSRDMKKYS